MLTANLLDGKKIAEQILDSVRNEIKSNEATPSLHVIFVGDDDASESYIKMKEKKAQSVGISTTVHNLPEETPQSNVVDRIHTLNNESHVDGIIVQLPLPNSFDELTVLEAVDPRKDVDGLHPVNFGKLLGGGQPYFYPPTPRGILALLDAYDVTISSRTVTLVGMGRLVGRPLSQMLLNEEATLLCLNEFTPNLQQYTRQGDIVVVGAGEPQFITEDHIESGTVVIDAGIHRIDGELVGDVEFDSVAEIAELITPVPGGVGPLTVAGLLRNTCESALEQH